MTASAAGDVVFFLRLLHYFPTADVFRRLIPFASGPFYLPIHHRLSRLLAHPRSTYLQILLCTAAVHLSRNNYWPDNGSHCSSLCGIRYAAAFTDTKNALQVSYSYTSGMRHHVIAWGCPIFTEARIGQKLFRLISHLKIGQNGLTDPGQDFVLHRPSIQCRSVVLKRLLS